MPSSFLLYPSSTYNTVLMSGDETVTLGEKKNPKQYGWEKQGYFLKKLHCPQTPYLQSSCHVEKINPLKTTVRYMQPNVVLVGKDGKLLQIFMNLHLVGFLEVQGKIFQKRGLITLP